MWLFNRKLEAKMKETLKILKSVWGIVTEQDAIIKRLNTELARTQADNKKLLQTVVETLESVESTSKIILFALNEGKTLKEISRSVFNTYPKATGILKDVQACNLHLLRDFKSYCDYLDIKFWLHAGTLIGALRNDGFVQWDDDVDVAMTRKDFNILKDNIRYNELLDLNEYYNDITCSRQYQLKYKTNQVPIFIDIAVYDTCSARTSAEQTRFWQNYRNTRRKMCNDFKTKIGAPPVIDIGYHHVGLYPDDIKIAVDALIDTASGSIREEGEKLTKPSYFYSIDNYPFSYPIMKYEQLFPLRLVKFETEELYIPAQPEFYLKYGYGNIWMPPKDIGSTPHLYAFESYALEMKAFIEERNKNV